MSRLKRVARGLRSFTLFFVGLTLGCGGFLWFAGGEIYDYQDTFVLADDSADIDVVVVLAGGKGRIVQASELWMQMQKVKSRPLLFFSGVGPTAGFETLADQGVSKEIISRMTRDTVVFENVSENTFENAQIFSSFARQNKWKRVVLVTASYHMRRAHFILRKALDPTIVILTHTADTRNFDRNAWHHDFYSIRVTLFEYVKWLYYRYSYR